MVNGSNQAWQLPGPFGLITGIMRNRMIIRIALLIAVALGIFHLTTMARNCELDHEHCLGSVVAILLVRTKGMLCEWH